MTPVLASEMANEIMVALEYAVRGALAYLALGAVLAPAIAFRGVNRFDPAAAHAGWAFRLLILPGAAAMWPLLMSRWVRSGRRPAGGDAGAAAKPAQKPGATAGGPGEGSP